MHRPRRALQDRVPCTPGGPVARPTGLSQRIAPPVPGSTRSTQPLRPVASTPPAGENQRGRNIHTCETSHLCNHGTAEHPLQARSGRPSLFHLLESNSRFQEVIRYRDNADFRRACGDGAVTQAHHGHRYPPWSPQTRLLHAFCGQGGHSERARVARFSRFEVKKSVVGTHTAQYSAVGRYKCPGGSPGRKKEIRK